METSRVLLFILRRFFQKSTFYNNIENLVNKSRTERIQYLFRDNFTANFHCKPKRKKNSKYPKKNTVAASTFDSTETSKPLETSSSTATEGN